MHEDAEILYLMTEVQSCGVIFKAPLGGSNGLNKVFTNVGSVEL